MRGVAPYHEAAFQTRHLAQKASPQGKLVRRLRSWIIKPIGFFVALLVALFSLIRYGRVMARLTGTVTDATGASVHEAEVSTSSATAPGRTDSTDFDGAYSLRLRRNTSYRLTVRFQNHLWYDEQIEKGFHEDVNTSALAYSLLSIVQAVAELRPLYPNDMELVAGVTDAWNDLLGSNFVVNAVWSIRTRALLGVIG